MCPLRESLQEIVASVARTWRVLKLPCGGMKNGTLTNAKDYGPDKLLNLIE